MLRLELRFWGGRLQKLSAIFIASCHGCTLDMIYDFVASLRQFRQFFPLRAPSFSNGKDAGRPYVQLTLEE